MLKRFHVPEEIAVRVPQERMRATIDDIFRKMGMPDEDAVQAADVLMYADIRGIDSHGVSNMMREYLKAFQAGQINPKPRWKIIRETGAVCTIDSDGGLGLVVGPAAMRVAIERAGKYGIGSVAVTNGRHFGAAAYHAAMALKHDMIGIAMTSGGVAMAPTFGAKPLVGLNPIAIAAPARREPPFIFDASMSSVAGNKIVLARRLGAGVLPGWIAQPDGTPIMEDQAVPDRYMLLPLGGTREIGSHKGYGLAVMAEVLTSVLSGGGIPPTRRGVMCHHFLAYSVEAFTEVDLFKDDMDTYLKALRECPPAPGHDRVLYAGLPEHEEEIERMRRGIPYHPEVIQWLQSIAAELGLPDRFR